MPASYAPKNQLTSMLYDVVGGTDSKYFVHCDDKEDAVRLRFRLNKLRQGDRRDRERDYRKRGIDPATVDLLSQFDRLVFRVEGSDVIIYKQEGFGENILSRFHAASEPAPTRYDRPDTEEGVRLNPPPEVEIFEL